MTVLSRYLLRLHLVPFIYALSALTGLLLLDQIAKKFGDLVGKGLPWTAIVEVFALSVPFLVAMTIPWSVLVGVLWAVSRLNTDNEITALRAGGISIGRIVRPLLVAAGILTVVAFLFNDQVLPRSNHRLRALLTDINRTKPTFSLKEQVINEVKRNRLFLRAGRINQATFMLYDVTVFDLGSQNNRRVTYADSARMAFTEDQEHLYLTLWDGSMHEFDRSNPGAFQIMQFERDRVRVEGVGNAFERTTDDQYRSDREMSVCQMDSVIRQARRDFTRSEQQAEAIELNSVRGLVGLRPVKLDQREARFGPSVYCRALDRVTSWLTPETAQAQESRARASDAAAQATIRISEEPPRINSAIVIRDRARNARIRAANYLVEVHKKYTIAAACLVFVLIGVPAAIKFPRGGVGLVIGLSTGVVTVYYVGLIAGESLANRLIVSPFWAMWTTNLMFAIVGLIGLWRIRTEATTVRAGGWGERWHLAKRRGGS